jgi:hypothetical protein
MNCHFCKTETPDGKIMFRDECERCGADLHICLNCSFHDPHASKQCREPAIPEEARDKELKNLCEYFQPREVGHKDRVTNRPVMMPGGSLRSCSNEICR